MPLQAILKFWLSKYMLPIFMTHQFRIRLKQGVYVATILLIILFFIKKGVDPWLTSLQYWPVMIGTVLLTPFTILAQVIVFRYCVPHDYISNVPPVQRLVKIWAMASITSIVAPFIAGLAVRVTLLKQEGLDIRISSVATVRQTWINVEYAWATASLLLLFYPWPVFDILGYLTITMWAFYRLAIVFLPSLQSLVPDYFKLLYQKFLKINFYFKLPIIARIWFFGQIVIMAINYSIAFWLGGASLQWHKCLLLTSLTILASLLIFIPHGLGVLDSLWVWIASQQGLSMTQSVALAITMRLGMFIGYGMVYLLLSIWDNISGSSVPGVKHIP